ncbi:MAG: hypothetical protein GY696_40260 [Gammaproteobacteria bacterium]|nr:hypothetical protein [Gammaproteobacteria bacterium]
MPAASTTSTTGFPPDQGAEIRRTCRQLASNRGTKKKPSSYSQDAASN